MKISDAIREWCDETDVGLNACTDLRVLANRIDREMVELPKDVDGVPIRIGDVVYGNLGVAWTVIGMILSEFGWIVKMNNVPVLYEPDDLTHKNPEPPDSWEKLEEDVNLGCRDYCKKHRLEECDYNMRVHMLARAKKLAGIERGMISDE